MFLLINSGLETIYCVGVRVVIYSGILARELVKPGCGVYKVGGRIMVLFMMFIEPPIGDLGFEVWFVWIIGVYLFYTLVFELVTGLEAGLF